MQAPSVSAGLCGGLSGLTVRSSGKEQAHYQNFSQNQKACSSILMHQRDHFYHLMRQLRAHPGPGFSLDGRRPPKIRITKIWQNLSNLYFVNADYVNNNHPNHGEIQKLPFSREQPNEAEILSTLWASRFFEIYPFWFSSKLNCRQFDAIIQFSLHSLRANISFYSLLSIECSAVIGSSLYCALCSARVVREAISGTAWIQTGRKRRVWDVLAPSLPSAGYFIFPDSGMFVVPRCQTRVSSPQGQTWANCLRMFPALSST